MLSLLLSVTPILAGAQTAAEEDEDSGNDPFKVLEETEDLSVKERLQQFEDSLESLDDTTRNEAALNEDPEARRRSKIDVESQLRSMWPDFELYGSVRLHAINAFDVFNEESETALGDGASRIGLRAAWQSKRKWSLFGRVESGFDVLKTFTPKAGSEDEDEDDRFGLRKRLLYAGIDSSILTAVYGKNWSTYYRIAGMADRFSIFGGNGVGIYNAGTDGGSTGMGRADDVLQTQVYIKALTRWDIKPFNLNLQYQYGQPIPRVENRRYGKAMGASAWLESTSGRGIGIAYNFAEISDPEDPAIRAAGIDGDAQALAVSFRSFGEAWYAALVVSWMENIETTDELRYINGRGMELYAQRQLTDKWWLIAGGSWLKPDGNDPDAGEFEIKYGVLGLRYTFDSFNRMVYAEYRWDHGTLWNGNPTENEFTIGVRWDFGY